MKANTEAVRARRYLLGQADDEECAVIEQDYLQDEDALDRIAAAEDDLIEDYLANQLDAADRDRFEQSYLDAPQHRVRVETIRRLMAERVPSVQPVRSTPQAYSRGWTPYGRWLALAASLIVGLFIWRTLSPPGKPGTDVVATRDGAQPPAPTTTETRPAAPTTPRVFALTVSPAAVRSASDSPRVAIPAGTDVVAIRLESEGDPRRLTARRASIRTVGGRDVWQGPVAADASLPRGILAQIDVPVASLPADDYLVTLFGTDQGGVEREWAQYFLRVRPE